MRYTNMDRKERQYKDIMALLKATIEDAGRTRQNSGLERTVNLLRHRLESVQCDVSILETMLEEA